MKFSPRLTMLLAAGLSFVIGILVFLYGFFQAIAQYSDSRWNNYAVMCYILSGILAIAAFFVRR